MLAILLVITLSAPLGLAQRGAAPRIVVIGDIHGDLDGFVGILRHAGITDENGRWIAGHTIVVQTGDYTDRGPKVRAVMDLLMELEQQSAAAGGRLVVLIGNHEVMNMVGDHRDVTPAIYATFADEKSAQRREAAYEVYLKFCAARAAPFQGSPPRLYQPVSKSDWMDAHPPGALEYWEALGPRGRYGRWLRTKSTVLQLGDTVFMHAGINPERATRRLDDINKQVTSEIRRFDEYRSRLIDRQLILSSFTLSEILTAAQIEVAIAAALSKSAQTGPQESLEAVTIPDPLRLAELLRIDRWALLDPEGPLWFRGFATWSSETGAVQMKNLMQRYNVARFVVGHTVVEAKRVTPRFSGAVILIDTGMVFPGGAASALEIRDRQFTAIYPEERALLFEAGERLAPAAR
jgi:hypothetical protein